MRHKTVEQPPDKMASLISCPGCQGEVVAASWRKGDSLFETCDCPSCNVSWGRVNGGLWHSLGPLGDDGGLKISRRP